MTKHKRTLKAINTKAFNLGTKSANGINNKWTVEDHQVLKAIYDIGNIQKLSNEQIKQMYNIARNQTRSDYSISEHLSMIKDSTFELQIAKVNNKGKKVQCIETNTIYNSVKDAAIQMNIPVESIRCFLSPNKHRKQCYGYTFKYVD